MHQPFQYHAWERAPDVEKQFLRIGIHYRSEHERQSTSSIRCEWVRIGPVARSVPTLSRLHIPTVALPPILNCSLLGITITIACQCQTSLQSVVHTKLAKGVRSHSVKTSLQPPLNVTDETSTCRCGSKPAGRKLVVCIDGTSNRFGTNVSIRCILSISY